MTCCLKFKHFQKYVLFSAFTLLFFLHLVFHLFICCFSCRQFVISWYQIKKLIDLLLVPSYHPPSSCVFVACSAAQHDSLRKVKREGKRARDKGVISTFHAHLFLIPELITLDGADRPVRKHGVAESHWKYFTENIKRLWNTEVQKAPPRVYKSYAVSSPPVICAVPALANTLHVTFNRAKLIQSSFYVAHRVSVELMF